VLKIVVHEHEPGRFQREVRALQRLNSPRVMRVHDDGEINTASGRFPYLRSEFVSGGDLREHLAAVPAPDDETIRSFVVELLRGLAELADERIVHRDLKPENIILRGGDWTLPVIIDLGLSRLLHATTFTIYPWAAGAWPYMAPEQLRMERKTDRTDMWGAAVVAAELAAGTHPFFRGEASILHDWDDRLRAGPPVPGSRPAALRDWIASGATFRGFQRPSASRSTTTICAPCSTGWPRTIRAAHWCSSVLWAGSGSRTAICWKAGSEQPRRSPGRAVAAPLVRGRSRRRAR
jgi:serine/threonine protein kinase